MSPKTAQNLFRLFVVIVLVALAVSYARAAPPVDYITRLLSDQPAPLAPLPMLPVYPVAVAPKPVPVAPKPKPAPRPPALSSRAQQAKNGVAIMAWLRALLVIPLRETGGYNRGPLIDSWARTAGNALGSEWCGLTQMADQRANKLPYPSGPAGSYNWFLAKYGRNVRQGATGSFDSAKVGYRVGIFNTRRGRIAHITAIDELHTKRQGNSPRGAWCIAGNEGSGKNAGVHRTWYPAANMHSISNWNY